MKKNKNAETLAGILVSLVVLSIVLFGIVSMLNSQTKISDDFQGKIEEKIFKKNIENILKNIYLAERKDIASGEDFYLDNDGTNINVSKQEDKKFKDSSLKNIDDVENYKQEVYKITLTRGQKIGDLGIESEPEIKIEKK
ncbi:hypothetical protein BKN14_05300 [Candidatus Gracilibacteria bacterium HOT-871]|nr:hypothetical protein BKN14_05300 [Candidatus Gracilibacteria bacterium HOT-871]RKW20568.1 MAG: hypothetical protein D8B46_09400 [Candidatus Gracilibacteria bacterium]